MTWDSSREVATTLREIFLAFGLEEIHSPDDEVDIRHAVFEIPGAIGVPNWWGMGRRVVIALGKASVYVYLPYDALRRERLIDVTTSNLRIKSAHDHTVYWVKLTFSIMSPR